jgi:AcrR family transcriptional regulator
LDAAEALMVDEGYAAVSSRRVASKAGTDAALVYYYFGTMDELFLALFRRGAQRSLERQAEALAAPQPLWALWHASQEQSSRALQLEFIALANHRKAVRAEIAEYSRQFRGLQLEHVSRALERYGVDTDAWPAQAIILVLSGTSWLLRTEDELGLDFGHAETTSMVERQLCALEGDHGTPTRGGASSEG